MDPRDAPKPPRVGESPASIARRWATAGEVRRISTGIDPLDELCRGGFAVPRRIAIVGAPGAGKTYLMICMADHMARAEDGPCVGLLGSDEDPDDLCVRIAQRAGYSAADLDRRDPPTMLALSASLERLRLRFYSSSWTIDDAGADIAAWAKAENRTGALFLDSIQTVSSVASNALERRDPRQIVEANTTAVRLLTDQHPIIVGYTSEANRSTYRSRAGSDQNDIASGAESRAIEYGSQVVLVLRTPPGLDDVVHAVVPKNRREHRSADGFFLRLDRARHELAECDPPDSDAAEDREQQQTERERGKVEAAAKHLLKAALTKPDMGTGELRRKSQSRASIADQAIDLLESDGFDGYRLANRGTDTRPKWHAERMDEPHE